MVVLSPAGPLRDISLFFPHLAVVFSPHSSLSDISTHILTCGGVVPSWPLRDISTHVLIYVGMSPPSLWETSLPTSYSLEVSSPPGLWEIPLCPRPHLVVLSSIHGPLRDISFRWGLNVIWYLIKGLNSLIRTVVAWAVDLALNLPRLEFRFLQLNTSGLGLGAVALRESQKGIVTTQKYGLADWYVCTL